MGDWSQCSNGCGEGVRVKHVSCVGLDGEVSDSCNDLLKPVLEIPCTDTSRCDYAWAASEWTECPTTCGEAERSRSVSCKSSAGLTVEDIFCSSGSKPENMAACSDYSECGYSWFYEDWGACAGDPWNETRTRAAKCVDYLNNQVADELCATEKEDSQPCPGESLMAYASYYEAIQLGETVNGYYKINGIKTYCDMVNGGWTLIAKAPSGNTDFRYDGRAWNDVAFGEVEGTGSYLSPHWSSLPISNVRLVLTGGVNTTLESTSSSIAPFSTLRVSAFNNGPTPLRTGSARPGCSWAQTSYYRFARTVWTGSCAHAINYYGLGIKRSTHQVGSGRLADGAPENDRVYNAAFELYVK